MISKELRSVALAFYEGLGCAASLKQAIRLRYDQWGDIFEEKNPHPLHFETSSSYFKAAAAVALFSKYDPGDSKMKKALEAKAESDWLLTERTCFETNRRLNELMDFGTINHGPASMAHLDFVSQARKAVHSILGARPPETWDGVFGPGATISDEFGHTTVPNKLSSIPTVTASALFYALPFIGTRWGQCATNRGRLFEVVKGNEYFTVPKKATALRTCAKEPSINAFYQRGLGVVMSKCLARKGNDIKTGKQRHMQVARDASLKGDFATIDLSKASDTIATSLVRMLLPSGWYEPLDDLRSHYTSLTKGREKRSYRLEKFSSMGNGFTFELETTLFAAIAMGADKSLILGKNLFVFGDDIILPTASCENVTAALRFCGLTLNEDKSFTIGPFRESCGGDFFLGDSVRGHFLEKEPNEPQEWISLANGLRRVHDQFIDLGDDVCPLSVPWFKCLDNLPTHIRGCRGPKVLGDIVIHDREASWNKRWHDDFQCFEVRAYIPVAPRGYRWNRFTSDVHWASVLYGSTWCDPLNSLLLENSREVVCRGMTGSYRIGWVVPHGTTEG